MGQGIAFALDEGGLGNRVKAYFDVNPQLPPKGLTVSSVTVIDAGDQSFMGLLKQVVSLRGAKELLLVVHGFLDGSGLAIPLMPGGIDTTGDHLLTLMQIAYSGNDPTDRQLAFLHMDMEKYTKFMALRRKVVEMNLTWVEWRSCDLGKRQETLDRFRIFFGATRMGAPMVEGLFGSSPVGIVADLDTIPERYKTGFTPYYYPDKSRPTVIHFVRLDPDTRDPVEARIFAASAAEMEKWIKNHINPNGRFVAGTDVRVHGLWKDPDADHPLDNPSMLLPLDPEYEQNIRYSEGPMFTGIMRVVGGAGSLDPVQVKKLIDSVYEKK